MKKFPLIVCIRLYPMLTFRCVTRGVTIAICTYYTRCFHGIVATYDILRKLIFNSCLAYFHCGIVLKVCTPHGRYTYTLCTRIYKRCGNWSELWTNDIWLIWFKTGCSLRLMTSQLKDIVIHTQKLRTVKCTFAVYGLKILCEISKGTFEILNPYTAKYAFYEVLKLGRIMIY